MKYSKLTMSILALLIICFLAVSCGNPASQRKYDGPKLAAFKFQNQTISGIDTVGLEVQLIRPVSGKPSHKVPINFVVIDSTTTATQNNYDILTPSPVTIPADCLRTTLSVAIDGTNIPAGSSRTLTIQLTGNKKYNVKGAVEIGQFDFLIVGQE